MASDDALMDWTETSSSFTQSEEVHTNNCYFLYIFCT